MRVTAERLIVDDGDVITSGGATTFTDLALYLVERFGGRKRANPAARVLLIDGARTSQLPYVHIAGEHRNHDDAAVHQAQTVIDAELAGFLRVGRLANELGLSSRTLARRSNTLSGSILRATQRRRIEAARRLLEAINEPVGNVHRQVGYSDPAASAAPSETRSGSHQATTDPSSAGCP